MVFAASSEGTWMALGALGSGWNALAQLKAKYPNIAVFEGNADQFDLGGEQFDAVYIHSGHLIWDRAADGCIHLNSAANANADGDLATDVEKFKQVIADTAASVHKHLKPVGLFLINIETWDDKEIDFGTSERYPGKKRYHYFRRILEDTAEYGSRAHVVIDLDHDEKVAKEIVKRRPKVDRATVDNILRDKGFDSFQSSENNHFFMAAKNIVT